MEIGIGMAQMDMKKSKKNCAYANVNLFERRKGRIFPLQLQRIK